LGATKIMDTVLVQTSTRFYMGDTVFVNNLAKIQLMEKLSAHSTQFNERKQP